MYITSPNPIIFAPTPVFHKRAGGTIKDGRYLLITAEEGRVATMLTVLQLKNNEGHGMEISASMSDQNELHIRTLVPQSTRLDGTPEISLLRVPLQNRSYQLIGRKGPVACLAPHDEHSCLVFAYAGYSLEFMRGNLVCPKCGRRQQLGTDLCAREPCICNQHLPELKIPFIIPPDPPPS